MDIIDNFLDYLYRVLGIVQFIVLGLFLVIFPIFLFKKALREKFYLKFLLLLIVLILGCWSVYTGIMSLIHDNYICDNFSGITARRHGC